MGRERRPRLRGGEEALLRQRHGGGGGREVQRPMHARGALPGELREDVFVDLPHERENRNISRQLK